MTFILIPNSNNTIPSHSHNEIIYSYVTIKLSIKYQPCTKSYNIIFILHKIYCLAQFKQKIIMSNLMRYYRHHYPMQLAWFHLYRTRWSYHFTSSHWNSKKISITAYEVKIGYLKMDLIGCPMALVVV